MAKIPFDIKYRPQIESGEYKAILECGIEAEILAWDKPGEYPIICVAKKDDAIPFRTDGNGKAYHYPEGANYSNLFLVTPAPELTEFEKMVREAIEYDPETSSEEEIEQAVRGYAEDILELAKKEALKDLPKWSKNAITRGCAAIDISGLTRADYIRREGKLLSISDLEKLPGFKEN